MIQIFPKKSFENSQVADKWTFKDFFLDLVRNKLLKIYKAGSDSSAFFQLRQKKH